MNLLYTARFRRNYARAPLTIRRAFDRRVAFLVENLLHSSLHAKKYDEAQDIWQARVNGGWRFYFRIEGDTYVSSISWRIPNSCGSDTSGAQYPQKYYRNISPLDGRCI